MQEKNKSRLKESKESKLIDRNGRVFGLISIIDVVVLLAVVVVCVGVYLKNNVLETTASNTQNVDITMVIEARLVEEYVADAIQVGDALYDKDHATGGPIGYITNIEYTEPRTIRELNDGSLTFVGGEDAVNVLVTLEGSGTMTDGIFSFNKIYELGLNAARNFETQYVTFTGYVMEIGQS